MAEHNQPAAAAAAAPLPPVPANNNRTILHAVSLWASVNAVIFVVVGIIADDTRCTKSTWVLWCYALTDTAAAELMALFYGGLSCSLAAALAVSLHLLLTEKTSGSCWAVDALVWVALTATAGTHCTEVASGCIALAAHPGDDTFFYVHVFLASLFLIVDLLTVAGLLLCSCSRRRYKLGEQGNGEPV